MSLNNIVCFLKQISRYFSHRQIYRVATEIKISSGEFAVGYLLLTSNSKWIQADHERLFCFVEKDELSSVPSLLMSTSPICLN